MVVEMLYETLPYVHWNTIFAYYNDINEFCNPRDVAKKLQSRLTNKLSRLFWLL